MAVKTDAWVVHAGEKGARRSARARPRDFRVLRPGPDEALVSPLFGCMEGNMGHILDRRPIDICLARSEPRCVPGNAGVVRVEKAGAQCTTVKDGDLAILFCNGQPDEFGYPRKIFGYDDPGSIGMMARTTKLKAHQMIPIPKDTKYALERWAAFSLRYVTAWSNWELAHGRCACCSTPRSCRTPTSGAGAAASPSASWCSPSTPAASPFRSPPPTTAWR